jgi:hypothetical protein
VIGIKHLIPLIPALVELVLEVAVAVVVEIEDAVDAHMVIALRSLVELDFLPLLVGRRVAPTGAVDEQIFRQPLDRDNFFLVLDVEGVEVTPKVLLLETLFNAAKQSAELRPAKIAFQEVLHDLLVYFLLHLLVLLVELGEVGALGEHLQAEELGAAVDSRVGLLLLLLQLDVERHLHGGKQPVEEVVDAVGRVGILNVIRTVADPGRNPLQGTNYALALLHLLEHLPQLLDYQSIWVFLDRAGGTCMQTYLPQYCLNSWANLSR